MVYNQIVTWTAFAILAMFFCVNTHNCAVNTLRQYVNVHCVTHCVLQPHTSMNRVDFTSSDKALHLVGRGSSNKTGREQGTKSSSLASFGVCEKVLGKCVWRGCSSLRAVVE